MENTNEINWKVDQSHSEVQFKVKHLVITTVTGFFRKFEGSVKSNSPEEFNEATVNFTVFTDSVDTNVEDRDKHLRSEEFFNSEKFPKMEFKNGMLHKSGGNKFSLKGDLTMRGHTQKVELDAELGGIAKDGYGQTKAGFEINGKIKRKEFGLKWDQVTESGNVVVGDEVKLQFNIQLIKQ